MKSVLFLLVVWLSLPVRAYAAPPSGLAGELASLCTGRSGCAARLLDRYRSAAPTDQRAIEWLRAVVSLDDPLPGNDDPHPLLVRIAGDLSSVERFADASRGLDLVAATRLDRAFDAAVDEPYRRLPRERRCAIADLLANQLLDSMSALGKLERQRSGTTAYLLILLRGEQEDDQLIAPEETCVTEPRTPAYGPRLTAPINVTLLGRRVFPTPMLLRLVVPPQHRPGTVADRLHFRWDLAHGIHVSECKRGEPCVGNGWSQIRAACPVIDIEIERRGDHLVTVRSAIEMPRNGGYPLTR